MTNRDERLSILVLVRDLFFSVKIGNELRGLGYTAVFAKTLAEFARQFEASPPALGILDLTAVDDWDAVRRLREDAATRNIPLLGYGPHKDVTGRRAALDAGVNRIVSNSQLHADLGTLVARYARQS